jgi:hypothetical protein
VDHAQTVEIRPSHRIEVGEVAKYLLAALHCDEWYVACRHDHLLVIQLSQQGRHRYAVRFGCTSPVDKAIYHGSKAWSLSILALHEEDHLAPAKMEEIRAGLTKLEQTPI